MNAKTWLVLGACLGGLAVGLGAFGAHGLPWYFRTLDVAVGEAARRSENWETAARYHMYHALAIIAVGLLAQRKRLWLLDASGVAFFFGILIFSGCLYALTLSGTKILGAIVPIGGVLFLVGWFLLALAGNQFRQASSAANAEMAEKSVGESDVDELSSGLPPADDESHSA